MTNEQEITRVQMVQQPSDNIERRDGRFALETLVTIAHDPLVQSVVSGISGAVAAKIIDAKKSPPPPPTNDK